MRAGSRKKYVHQQVRMTPSQPSGTATQNSTRVTTAKMAMNFQPSRWIGTRTERMVSMKSSAPAKKCRRQCSDSPPRLKGVRDCSAGRFPTRNLNLAARPAGLEAAEPVGQADADGVALQFRRMSQHRAATSSLADRE